MPAIEHHVTDTLRIVIPMIKHSRVTEEELITLKKEIGSHYKKVNDMKKTVEEIHIVLNCIS